MSGLPNCPECGSEHTYEDGSLIVCPMCNHEWASGEQAVEPADGEFVVRDANGNVLADGDSISVVKDLKVKGASSAVKVGTKVKNIRLIDPAQNADHNIDCKIDGFGAMRLKSEYVKKA